MEISQTATTHVIEVRETSVRAIDESSARFVATFRKLDNKLWNHPIGIILSLVLISVVFSSLTTVMFMKLTTDRLTRQAIEASTQTTQENLEPVMQKIKEQTRDLDQTYQESENWQYHLSTLPANQRDSFRWKTQQAAIEQKRKIAADMQR